MWSPTHVQVTVQRTKNLIVKSKNAKNDLFVTIGLGKEKYQTSSKEKNADNDFTEWHEVCELQIPKQGNTAQLILSVLHRNFLGLDHLLGQTVIPLAEIDVYERPKSKWYPLQGKNKVCGELQVKIAFTVRSGSLLDLTKKDKHKLSVGQLSSTASNISLSVSNIDKKSFKKLAKTITGKIKREKKIQEMSPDINLSMENQNKNSLQAEDDAADPGVISDEDEFGLEDLSHKGSACSLETSYSDRKIMNSSPVSGLLVTNINTSVESIINSDIMSKSPILNRSPNSQAQNEWKMKLYKNNKDKYKLKDNIDNPMDKIKDKSPTSSIKNSPKVQKKYLSPLDDRKSNINESDNFSSKSKSALSSWNKAYERIIIGKEKDLNHNQNLPSKLSSEVLQKFDGKTRDDLIEMVIRLQSDLNEQIKQKTDLEEYLDKLLLRVMETSPKILQTPYICFTHNNHFL